MIVRRWRGLPIAVSIAAHVAVFAWIASRMDRLPELIVVRIVERAPPIRGDSMPPTRSTQNDPRKTIPEHAHAHEHAHADASGGSSGTVRVESAPPTADEGSVLV